MSLSTCDKCGGHIPLGPRASNVCENCGGGVFDCVNKSDQTPQWIGGEAMSKIEQLATITLIKYEGEPIECVITSHPDGCELEQCCKAVVETMRAMMDAAHDNKKDKP